MSDSPVAASSPSALGAPSRSPVRVTAALVVLTLLMLGVSRAELSRTLELVLLVGAMVVQVGLIAAFSMRLREAHAGILWTFIGGLLFTAVLLYVLVVPDAIRIHEMVTAP